MPCRVDCVFLGTLAVLMEHPIEYTVDPSEDWRFPGSKVARRTATSLDIAWFAGFFEGEGSYSETHIHVTQITRWPLDLIREAFGGRVVEFESNSINGRIRAFRWYATGRRARGIAMTLYPFLSPRRQLQTRRFLKVSRMSDPPPNRIPSTDLLRRLARGSDR